MVALSLLPFRCRFLRPLGLDASAFLRSSFSSFPPSPAFGFITTIIFIVISKQGFVQRFIFGRGRHSSGKRHSSRITISIHCCCIIIIHGSCGGSRARSMGCTSSSSLLSMRIVGSVMGGSGIIRIAVIHLD